MHNSTSSTPENILLVTVMIFGAAAFAVLWTLSRLTAWLSSVHNNWLPDYNNSGLSIKASKPRRSRPNGHPKILFESGTKDNSFMQNSDSQNTSDPKTAPSNEETKPKQELPLTLRIHIPFDYDTTNDFYKVKGKLPEGYSKEFAAAISAAEDWITKRFNDVLEEVQPMVFSFDGTRYQVPGMMLQTRVPRIEKIDRETQIKQVLKKLGELAGEVHKHLDEAEPIYYAVEKEYGILDIQ